MFPLSLRPLLGRVRLRRASTSAKMGGPFGTGKRDSSMGYSESAWQNMLGDIVHSLDGKSLELVRLRHRIPR